MYASTNINFLNKENVTLIKKILFIPANVKKKINSNFYDMYIFRYFGNCQVVGNRLKFIM